MLTLFLVGSFGLVSDVRLAAAGAETVYINSDGSVIPIGAPISTLDNVTYTLTGDISYPTYNGIVAERSSIMINGNGYTVKGNSGGAGLNVTSMSNVTIKNVNINSFWYGVYFYSSVNNTVSGSNLTANGFGVDLESSSNNTISGNTASANTYAGIWLWECSDNTLSGNNATANTQMGIYLSFSNSSTINGNIASANEDCGISLYSSYNNMIGWNDATASYIYDGIDLVYSSNNAVLYNNASANNDDGIWANYSSDNLIGGNNVSANRDCGIHIIYSSDNNDISGNNVTNNNIAGLSLQSCSGNTIYHNNFVGNTAHASVDAASLHNAWNDSYPLGGNYWDNYTGVDMKRGPNQDVPGSDGIGDTNHTIDANNHDYYPLMAPWSEGPSPVHDVAVTNVTTCKDWCKPFPTVPQYYFMHVNVTVQSLGAFTEDFSVTTYADSFMINQTQLSLPVATTIVLTIRWNATLAYGNYTISAVADTVLGETDTLDNTFPDGMILVTIPGDINGDTYVNAKDAVLLGTAFNSNQGQPSYDPNADINGDQWCNAKDAVILGTHFNEHW
jgi:parallel beta-helix repeat protein